MIARSGTRDAQIVSRTDRAYTEIKRRLISLELAPGDHFSESQLSRELDLGKTPVREALGRLRNEGLVDVTARSGYRATPITLKDVHDLFALRLMLEGEAAAQAAAPTSDRASLIALEDLCRRSYDPSNRASISTFLAANTEFHAKVALVGGNRYLAESLRRVLDLSERLFHLGLALSPRADEIVHEHEDLLNAIIAHDPNKARQVALAQVRASQRMVVQGLLASPALLGANLLSPNDTRSAGL